MIDTQFWHKVNQQQADYDQSRRAIGGVASQALHMSKQAIFALHRDGLDDAAQKLSTAREMLAGLETQYNATPGLRHEGSWSAAMEEWVEATLFDQYVRGQKVGEITGVAVMANEYIGGLSDYTGELLRRAVLLATKKDFDGVKTIATEISDAIQVLLAYNLSGVLRTKFDQAKRNQQKIEEIMYDISL